MSCNTIYPNLSQESQVNLSSNRAEVLAEIPRPLLVRQPLVFLRNLECVPHDRPATRTGRVPHLPLPDANVGESCRTGH